MGNSPGPSGVLRRCRSCRISDTQPYAPLSEIRSDADRSARIRGSRRSSRVSHCHRRGRLHAGSLAAAPKAPEVYREPRRVLRTFVSGFGTAVDTPKSHRIDASLALHHGLRNTLSCGSIALSTTVMRALQRLREGVVGASTVLHETS